MKYVYAVYESYYDQAQIHETLLAVYATEDDADYAALELEEACDFDAFTEFRVDRLEVK
jgi:hypothetical protein